MTEAPNQNHSDKEIKIKIQQSFKTYFEYVMNFFKENDNVKKIRYLDLISSNSDKIEEVENSEEFSILIDDTMHLDSPFMKSQFLCRSKGTWKFAIKNFFRRSNCYTDILNNRPIDQENLFICYLKSFKYKFTITSHYALIESVHFPKKELDFGSFKICRFNKTELDTLFSNKINEIFYPYATIDSNKLKDYWFICVTENSIYENELVKLDEKVRFKHSTFPKEIELVLKKLALFDWHYFGQESYWWTVPEISHMFTVSNNLLSSPCPNRFDYRQLLTEPFIDSRTGEELGEQPITIFHLDEEFEQFINKIEKTFKILYQNNELHFIDNALGHFIKAFCSEGVEQLLWHITTIEALLNSKSSDLTNSLARRLALIIERRPEKRKELYDKFKNLYDFRSKLVHGNPEIVKEQNHLNFEHLNNARNISRHVLLWFLDYVSKNIKKFKNRNSEKIREEICLIIDLKPEDVIN